MTKSLIVDISHHQPSNKIDWAKAAEEVAIFIIRVQYGSSTIDREYKNHVANCKKYGISFAHYAYGRYVSVADAKVEARDFLNRMDRDAQFAVLDTEDDTLDSCGANNIAEASQAFIDVCKTAGYKTGFYISHNMCKSYGLDKVKADFLWIPRYGNNDGKQNIKPSYPCDLWQYTSQGKTSFYGGPLDLNVLNGSKPLSYFTGQSEQPDEFPTVQKQIGVNVNGTRIGDGYLIDNTSYIPARLVVEAMGANIKYDGQSIDIERK